MGPIPEALNKAILRICCQRSQVKKPLPDSLLHRLNWSDPGRTNRHALYQQKALDVYFIEDFTVYHFDIPGESCGSLNADML